ncbi:MAG: phage tail-type lysozyme domain-containing protein [Clostridiales Family XIII bacterium]|jgi:hypothetical protein|nr:phage tail-type lysozyme domain-containing protein [Clostridiales Family XIII bacterium]
MIMIMMEVAKKIALFIFGFYVSFKEAALKVLKRVDFAAPACILVTAMMLLTPGIFSYAKEIGSGSGTEPGEYPAYQAWLLGVPVPEAIVERNPKAVAKNTEAAVDKTDGAGVSLITGKSKLDVPTKEHAVKLTGDPGTNEGRMWKYLLDQGFTPEQAAGIIGNALKENGTLNPGKNGDSGAFGIFQYTGGRKARVQSLANGYTLEGQLDYMMIELSGGYAALNEALRNAATIEEAVILFQDEYERPGIAGTDMRLEKAYETYARYIGAVPQAI